MPFAISSISIRLLDKNISSYKKIQSCLIKNFVYDIKLPFNRQFATLDLAWFSHGRFMIISGCLWEDFLGAMDSHYKVKTVSRSPRPFYLCLERGLYVDMGSWYRVYMYEYLCRDLVNDRGHGKRKLDKNVQIYTVLSDEPAPFSGLEHLQAMMTSSNGNIFRVTGHLCGKFTGPRWISRTKASDAELWCFLWFTPE